MSNNLNDPSNQSNSNSEDKSTPLQSELITKDIIHITEDHLSACKESRYRFVIVMVYCLVTYSNAVHWVTFSSCAFNFKTAYGLNNFQVDLFSLVYMIAYPIVFIPESYIVDNMNMRLGVSIGACLTMLGAGIKCLINYNLLFAYLGQTLIAVFQPAILNSPSKIASRWFNEKSRVLATSVCCVANSIGVLTGYIIHSAFIDPESKGEIFKAQFSTYVFAEFIGTAVFCSPLLFFMKSRPNSPPSKSQSNYVSPSVKENLKILIKSKNYLLLLGSTSCVIGFFNIFGTIINQYLTLYHLPDLEITYIAVVGNSLGIVASLCVSYFLDSNKKYKKNLLTLNCIAFVASIAVTLLLEFISDDYSLYIAFPLYSVIYITLVPVFTITMDYVCELTYPCGESIAVGMIMSSNQISGIIGIIICDIFLVYLEQYRFLSNAFGALLFLMSIVFFALIKERLIRNEKDTGVLIKEDSVNEGVKES